MPLQFNDGDFVLASYPRSGNTWLRFILAHLMAGGQEEITFHNYHRYIPDICFIQNDADWQGYAPFPRIIKSHMLPQPEYKNAIYIVRDPRAALVSYRHYEGKPCAFRQFIRSRELWPCTWSRHVEKWIEHGKANKVLVLKYEDMFHAPFEQILLVLEHLGAAQIDNAAIRKSLSRMSFTNMDRIEKEQGFWRPLRGEKFVRMGKPDGWMQELSPPDAEEVVRINYDQMKYFNYL